jgi:hypothetical protein
VAIVHGVRKFYEVNLKNFDCDCGSFFDETLHIPVSAKRRQGRPKKNDTIIGAREKAVIKIRKLDQVKKN